MYKVKRVHFLLQHMKKKFTYKLKHFLNIRIQTFKDDAPSTRKRMTKTAEENTLISNNGENNDSSEGPTAAKKMSLSEPISPANEEASSEITTGGRPKRSRR